MPGALRRHGARCAERRRLLRLLSEASPFIAGSSTLCTVTSM
jgi:hypothetical protein